MKNLIYKFFILIIMILMSATSFAGNKEKLDTASCIEIDGKVLIPKTDDLKQYKIQLLCHNTVIDSVDVIDDESFLLKIKKNSWYTIRIIKEGYYPMNVSINTKVPGSSTNEHKFHFDTELIADNKNIADQDAIDFPIAIISYNSKKKVFTPIIDYSLNIKSSLFDIREINEGFAKADVEK